MRTTHVNTPSIPPTTYNTAECAAVLPQQQAVELLDHPHKLTHSHRPRRPGTAVQAAVVLEQTGERPWGATRGTHRRVVRGAAWL